MARISRSRSRSKIGSAGTQTGYWGIPVNVKRTAITTEVCLDSSGGPVVDSPFLMNRVDRSQATGFSGVPIPPLPDWSMSYDKFPYEYQVSSSVGHIPTDAPPDSALGATVLSRTNPSRPVIVPFGLVQDLYDVPRMLKDVGKLLRTPRRLLNPREQANQFLGAKFGWLPLIDDANKLIHLQDYVDKRLREINRLYSAQGLRRRVQLGRFHGTDKQVQLLAYEAGLLVTGNMSWDTEEKVWGTVRWKPSDVPPGYNPSDAERIRQAKLVCSGLTPEGLVKGAWDLLPWTWMIDWFGNVGDWLTQSSSTIPASSGNVNVMRSKTTVQQHKVNDKPDWLIDHGGLVTSTTLSRTQQSGTLSASLPTLDANRLSVLSALFVQRFKR